MQYVRFPIILKHSNKSISIEVCWFRLTTSQGHNRLSRRVLVWTSSEPKTESSVETCSNLNQQLSMPIMSKEVCCFRYAASRRQSHLKILDFDKLFVKVYHAYRSVLILACKRSKPQASQEKWADFDVLLVRATIVFRDMC